MKNTDSFFKVSIAVDVVLFTIEDNQLKLLVIKRSGEPFKNSYSLPGGFVLEGETTRDAALRILNAKAGIEADYIEQLYTFDSTDRDPRGQIYSVTYFALAPRENIEIKEISSSQQPSFASIADVKKMNLAFDHADIIAYAIKRLQAKLEYTNVAYSILPRYFTLAQLQKTYEIILDTTLDKRNFQKKFFQLGLISATRKIFKGNRQRPARLYEFKSRTPSELRKFF